MIKFLIHRPVSVITLFVGLLILAAISIRNTTVSLLPDLDIPVMIIQVDAPNLSPMEVERRSLMPLRRQLLTMNGIEDLVTEAHWGSGEVRITFTYGWDMDKAFIETNEKVDLSLNQIPKDIRRPRVVKTRAEDLPSYLLTLGRAEDQPGVPFLDISEFAREVLRRRLEQAEEIALVDIHGTEKLQIEIIPNEAKMAMLGIDQQLIQRELRNQDIPVSNIQVRERNYEYLVQIGHPLHNIHTVKDIKIVIGERVLRLAEIATVRYAGQESTGLYIDQGEKAVSLAVIKTPAASLDDLKLSLDEIAKWVAQEYPEMDLLITRDQAKLLKVTVSNLYSSLILGCILAVGIVFFFYSYWRIPVLMALIIPMSLMISLLFFQAFGISINMLSLSGILLGLGLMIDNGIIVLDNISQEWTVEEDLAGACIRGTNEMIRPLLTSMLTTCSVFIPLMFLSGLAGALFWDQALAVSICLVVSYLVSILLLPTLYYALIKRKHFKKMGNKNRLVRKLESWYDRGMHFSLNRKYIIGISVILFCLVAYFITQRIGVERFPELPEEAIEVNIDWNEPVLPEMAANRLKLVFQEVKESWQAHIGTGQYLLNNFYDGDATSAEVFVQYGEDSDKRDIKGSILSTLAREFPDAIATIKSERTAFHMIFPEGEEMLEVKCFLPTASDTEKNGVYRDFYHQILAELRSEEEIKTPAKDKSYFLLPDLQKMLYYEVDKNVLLDELKKSLGHHEVMQITSFQYQLPVVIKSEKIDIHKLIHTKSVHNKKGARIPLKELLTLQDRSELRTIFANADGVYAPIWINSSRQGELKKKIKKIAAAYPMLKITIFGSDEQNNQAFIEILFAILASILLLYFLMAAQFESLLLPIIILAEIPISLAGSISFLWLFGIPVNIMSAIGMVVTIGIIINDSIIKIDTIHRLKRSGIEMRKAIHQGGMKRLNPILMTSLTTILAVIPFLWGDDLGRMLQRPLAVSLIGGMVVGTLVSLFVIPVLYQLFGNLTTVKYKK